MATSTAAEGAGTALPAGRAVEYRTVQPAVAQADLAAIAQHMFALMFRNVSSDGYAFADPTDPSQFSRPGCIIASPSYHASFPAVDQNYVFNWTRDAAVTAIELAAAELPTNQPLIDYVDVRADLPEQRPADRVRLLHDRGPASGQTGQSSPTGRRCRRWRSCGCTPSSTRRRRRSPAT